MLRSWGQLAADWPGWTGSTDAGPQHKLLSLWSCDQGAPASPPLCPVGSETEGGASRPLRCWLGLRARHLPPCPTLWIPWAAEGRTGPFPSRKPTSGGGLQNGPGAGGPATHTLGPGQGCCFGASRTRWQVGPGSCLRASVSKGLQWGRRKGFKSLLQEPKAASEKPGQMPRQ